MLLTIAAILFVLWLIGLFTVGGSLIHILLVVALVAFIANMLTGRRSTV